MMSTHSFAASFLFLSLCGGCAANGLAHPKTPSLAETDPDLAPLPRSAMTQAPPTVGGDIQFTMQDRQAKASPASDDTTATALQPLKANTSGVTTTGVNLQHVHPSQ